MTPRRASGLAWCLAVIAALPARAQPDEPPPAAERQSEETQLARAASLFESGEYGACAGQLRDLLDPTDPDRLRRAESIERARVLAAACLLGSGEPERADEMLRAALRENPLMPEPDARVFPEAVITRFNAVRQQMQEEIRKAEQARIEKARAEAAKARAAQQADQERVAELERLASQETMVLYNRRWISFVPFGVGQFQNGDTALGWVFLSAEALLAGVAITSIVVPTYLQRESTERANVDVTQLNELLDDWHTVSLVSGWGLLGVAALGVVEAQLSYEPIAGRWVRTRPLPDKLRNPNAARIEIRPHMAPTAGGAQLGLSGRF